MCWEAMVLIQNNYKNPCFTGCILNIEQETLIPIEFGQISISGSREEVVWGSSFPYII